MDMADSPENPTDESQPRRLRNMAELARMAAQVQALKADSAALNASAQDPGAAAHPYPAA